MKKKIKNLVIHGRRWFDRKNGNTYHTVEVFVNGVNIGKSIIRYGYGEQYIDSALEILQLHDLWPQTGEYLSSGISKDRNDFTVFLRDSKPKPVTICSDVSRQKDL